MSWESEYKRGNEREVKRKKKMMVMKGGGREKGKRITSGREEGHKEWQLLLDAVLSDQTGNSWELCSIFCLF